MTRYTYLLGLIILSSISCPAQQKPNFEKKIYIQQQDTLPYRLLFPQRYDTSTKYPLVVFLHGAGTRGNDNEAALRNLPDVFLSDSNRTNFPCFIIVPQCPRTDTWANFWEFPKSLRTTDTPTIAARMVLSLIDDLSSELSIDHRRIYLTGYSMGGEGTFDLLSRKPKLFAAAIAVCPAADTSRAASIKDNNIWVFHGSADNVTDVKYSRMMIEALKKNGGNPIYTEYPGVGHQCWIYAYKEPGLLRWLFSFRSL